MNRVLSSRLEELFVLLNETSEQAIKGHTDVFELVIPVF